MYKYKYIDKDGLEREIQTDLKIGDVICIKDFGCLYDTYRKAYEYFSSKVLGFKRISKITDKLWRVAGICVNENELYGVMYFLKGQRGAEIIIVGCSDLEEEYHPYKPNKYYKEIPYLTTHFSKQFAELNENYVVKQLKPTYI